MAVWTKAHIENIQTIASCTGDIVCCVGGRVLLASVYEQPLAFPYTTANPAHTGVHGINTGWVILSSYYHWLNSLTVAVTA